VVLPEGELMQIAFDKKRYSGIHNCPLCGETLVTSDCDPADPLMQVAYCPNFFCAAERVSLSSDDGTLHKKLVSEIEDFLLNEVSLIADLEKEDRAYWLAHDLAELVEEVINGWLEPMTEKKEDEAEN
jgi:hypothetical protein